MNLTTLMGYPPRLYTALAEWGPAWYISSSCAENVRLETVIFPGRKLLIILLPIMNLQELFRSTSGFPV